MRNFEIFCGTGGYRRLLRLLEMAMIKKVRTTVDETELVWAASMPNRYKDSIYPDQPLVEFDNEYNLLETTLAGKKVVCTVASRCSCEPQPKLPEETYAFWMERIPNTRLIPLKEGTRNHLQRLKDNKTAGYEELPTSKKSSKAREADDKVPVAGKRFGPRITISVPAKQKSTNSTRTTRRTTKSAATAIYDESDIEEVQDDITPDILLPALRSKSRRRKRLPFEAPATNLKLKKQRTTKSAAASLDDDDATNLKMKKRTKTKSAAAAVDNDSDIEWVADFDEIAKPRGRRSKKSPPTASYGESDIEEEDIQVLPPPPDVLSVPEGQRRPLPLHDIAMSALSLPKFERSFMKFATVHHQAVEGATSSVKLAASLFCPTIGRNWSPPSDLGQDVVSTFFSRSLVTSDGIRYHESRSQAILYCLMAAVLTGDESCVTDAVRSTKLLRGSLEQPVVLFNNLSNRRCHTPIAVIVRDEHGSIYFSFVDKRGSFVGKQITFSSKK